MAEALSIWLHDRRVGTLTNLGGDYNLFNFDDAYLDDDQRPVLSQSFIGVSGAPVRVIPRTHRVAPAYFANLLPEEGNVLRAIVARQYRINRTRDFPYLRVLGGDLPGAVVIRGITESDDAATLEETLLPAERPLRFSLAGVQPKFSASLVAGRLTVPMEGAGDSWIVKLPTNAFAQLPQNEFAVMSFARSIGFNVPDMTLVDVDTIDGLPAELPGLHPSEPRAALAVTRFDRGANGTRIHNEDFNQIAGQQPNDKYENKSSSWIANVISTICPPEDVDDFVRRLIFGVCVGNNDMHLKNWALTYPDGRNARLAPLYDYVCTRAYYPAGTLALTIGGEREFERIDHDALRMFARLARISVRRTLVLADELIAAIREQWTRTEATIENVALRATLAHHFETVPIMRAR